MNPSDLINELKSLPGPAEVLEALGEDLEGARRYAGLDSHALAHLCGVVVGRNEVSRVSYAAWICFDDCPEPWSYVLELEPYVSPGRWKVLREMAGAAEADGGEFDERMFEPRELEVLYLLHNLRNCEDRGYLGVSATELGDSQGRLVRFEHWIGDAGSVECVHGPYHFGSPDGIPCHEPSSAEHPETGRTLGDLRWPAGD